MAAVLPLTEVIPTDGCLSLLPCPHRRDNEAHILFKLLVVSPVVNDLRKHTVSVPFWINLCKQVFRFCIR